MKIFMFLHQCPFLHVNPPTKLSLDEFGWLKLTKIRAQTADFTQSQVDLLPPPISLPNQLPDLDNHLICYTQLKNAFVQKFNTKLNNCDGQQNTVMPLPYTHFDFDIFERPSLASQPQGHQLNMEHELKMRITDDLGNDWLKILRRVCGGDKVKISVSLEVGRKLGNGEILKATLGINGMEIFDLNGNCFCVGPNLNVNQVDELMALLNSDHGRAAPWAMFTGKVTVSLEIDEDIDLFGKTTPVQLEEVTMDILESGVDANVEIYPGGFAAPIRCHHNFLAARSPVLQVILQQPVPEGQMKRIDMPEASEKCVRALLLYLYSGYLSLDEEDDIILMELWKVARKYEMVELEKEMKNKLGDKPISGISARLAIELFCWTRNLVNDDAGRRLKEKAVLALKSKLEFNELETAPEYIRLFENDPVAARDLCRCAFQT